MNNMWKASTLVLAGALSLVVGRSAMISDVAAEPQPAMSKAVERLVEAKRFLESATPDKGGHRVKALEAVNLALTETREGIKYDNVELVAPGPQPELRRFSFLTEVPGHATDFQKVNWNGLYPSAKVRDLDEVGLRHWL